MHAFTDLRSDTVTKPTAAMRLAMTNAEVGDDVLGDDPTLQRLESIAAALLGKEAALFVPSGTMANNIAIKVHTQPGDEILLDWEAHSMCYEVAGAAALSGVLTRQFRCIKGVPDPNEIAASIQKPDLHAPGTTLVVLENTHNRAGGTIIPLQTMETIYNIVRDQGIKLHLDGARLFNAAIASGVRASEFAANADSVSFCLSKGLGCPVGSLVCGSSDFIDKARRVRKLFGGGMRQAGILAACGLVALDCMIDRLAEDHAKARRLAEGISGIPDINLDLQRVQTNMVYFGTTRNPQLVVDDLAKRQVKCLVVGGKVRMVAHKDVDEEDIDRAIKAVRKLPA